MRLSAVHAIVGVLFLLVFSVFLSTTDQSSIELAEAKPVSLYYEGLLPALSAKAYAIFDVTSGAVVVSKEAETVLPIASVTKLVTATAVLRNLPLEEKATVSVSDVDAYGRAGRLQVGDIYTNYDLLFPLLLESSNDAAAVYERRTGGEVVTLMNRLVADMGAENTHFADASGLSDSNVSTANDLVKIVSDLNRDEPHIFDISRLSKKMGEYVGWANNSPVWQADYLGGKHGFTEAAGKTAAVLFSEEIDGKEKVIGYIILGSKDLVTDTANLRDFVRDSVHFE
ncbi:MAG: serine hydrolase [Candidatus Paceibacterota bacterium]